MRDALGSEVVSTRHAAQAVNTKCALWARLAGEGGCTRCAHGPVAWVCTGAGCRRAGANTSSCNPLAGAGVAACSPADGILVRPKGTGQGLHGLQVEVHNRRMGLLVLRQGRQTACAGPMSLWPARACRAQRKQGRSSKHTPPVHPAQQVRAPGRSSQVEPCMQRWNRRRLQQSSARWGMPDKVAGCRLH